MQETSIRKHMIWVLCVVVAIVVIAYSLLLNWYFRLGLIESNRMAMYIETQRFITTYSEQRSKPYTWPPSMSGYIGWSEVPQSLKEEFPDLEQVDSFEFESTHVRNPDSFGGFPGMLVILASSPLTDGQLFYLYREVNLAEHSEYAKRRLLLTVISTTPFAIVFLILMLGTVYFLLRQISQPLIKLEDWSNHLSLDNLYEEPLDFRYSEFNRLAANQQRAIGTVGETLAKEKVFLQDASHELRTPIAIIKSNTELLERIHQNNESVSTTQSIQRLKRAASNMQSIIETLLWLSRYEKHGSQHSRDKSTVDVASVLEKVIQDNRYLLQNRNVRLSLDLNSHIIDVEEHMLRLVLNNLVRNAFQFTQVGYVEISSEGHKITISNKDLSEGETPHSPDDHGYGLGLRLVDRIVAITNWRCKYKEMYGGRTVSLNLAPINS